MYFKLLTDIIYNGEEQHQVTTAIHAADQLLLEWQNKTDLWQQLLQQVFRRSAAIDLCDITIEILDGNTMAGLHGAYAHASPDGGERIYLNADWLEIADEKALQSVLLEEIGHAIDYRLNGYKDTPGDEGAVFSALVRGLDIPIGETKQNDNHTLNINGQKIFVEAAAPILNTSASPLLNTISEDSGVPTGVVGTLVSDLIDSGGSLNNYSDSDGDSPAIAIVGTNLGGGTLYYSVNNGTSWSDVGSVSSSSARVLYADSNTRLAFAPAANFNGTINDLITFNAWDRTGTATNGAGSINGCLLYTSPSPRDATLSRMPSSA